MLKGVLPVLLLHVVGEEDSYGYGIVTTLQAGGFADLQEGTVYPALARLEQQGFLESYLQRSGSGPARKYYRLTGAGQEELGRTRAVWDQLVAAVQHVITGSLVTSPEGK